MIIYLTKQYDIDEGPLFPKTPLQYCKEKYAKKAEDVINRNLNNLRYNGNTVSNIISPTVGEISKDRVKEAKARLQEIRANSIKKQLLDLVHWVIDRFNIHQMYMTFKMCKNYN